MWLFSLLVLVSVSVLYAYSVCIEDFYLGLDSLVASSWECAAHSISQMFSYVCLPFNCSSSCSLLFSYFFLVVVLVVSQIRKRELGPDYTSS